MNTRSNKQGFTLIELLVVIAIIGILSSVVLASIKDVRMRANDAARISDIRSIKTAMEMYRSDNNQYPQYAGPDESVYLKRLAPFLAPTYIPMMPHFITQDVDSYTWSGTDSYGFYVFTEGTQSYCRTGVNMNPSWWSGAPDCSF